jgi:hypothetical protein
LGSDRAAGRQPLETILFGLASHQKLAKSQQGVSLGIDKPAACSSGAGARRFAPKGELGRTDMNKLSRRSVLRGSVGLAAGGAIGRPFIANAAAKTARAWWTQGFVPEEDAAFRFVVAEYEKASGNNIDVSIIPFAPMRQKIVSALTSGDLPDVMQEYNAGVTIVPQYAWNDKLVDLTDVVETQAAQYHPTAILASQYYNNVTKRRSTYYAPIATFVLPFHIWNSLVEKAGYKMSDAPKTWDAFWISSSRCRRSCATKGCAASMPWGSSRPPPDRTTAIIFSITS